LPAPPPGVRFFVRGRVGVILTRHGTGGYVETIIDRSVLEEFRAGLRGTAYALDEGGYDEGRQAFNLNAHQHPALVVMAAGAADVMAAVRLARFDGRVAGQRFNRPKHLGWSKFGWLARRRVR
jgi:hypothetical protein